MKRKLFTLLACVICALSLTAFASAAENTIKVGLYYDDRALDSANLTNEVGFGYSVGWFDESSRVFNPVGSVGESAVTVTVNCGYHVQIEDEFASYEEAKFVADQFRTGFVCYINNTYRVRVNTFSSRADAEAAAATYTTYVWYDIFGAVHRFFGSATSPSGTGITVLSSETNKILFEFDCSGAKSLGILPNDGAPGTLTSFKGNTWYGGFEFRRSTGGNINVINVVDLEDYVKGVVPNEMYTSWPIEALKAQAVCARTYVLMQTKHYKSHKFDVCNTTCCQAYRGIGKANAATDQAVEETRGVVLTYNGELAAAYYCQSNGGASESPENVWTSALPHLIGKEDPYEATITIPGYHYTLTYTFDQLTQILQNKGKYIGMVTSVFVSKTTPTGNVLEVTFVGTNGSYTERGINCSYLLSTKSMRFTISGGENTSNYYINDAANGVPTVNGLYTINGSQEISGYTGGDTYVITSSGVKPLENGNDLDEGSYITITGTGYGHNIGMSQYGAKAMAGLGYTYEDILHFYYTGITLERIG